MVLGLMSLKRLQLVSSSMQPFIADGAQPQSLALLNHLHGALN